MIRILLTLTFLLLSSTVNATEYADKVLLNGNVITVNKRDSVQHAIAIEGQHILAVASNAEIELLAGPDTEVFDLEGKTVTPGLLDAHAHFASGGLSRLQNIDLSYPNVKSIADIVSLVNERNAALSDGGWIVDRGWDEGKLKESRYVLASDIEGVSGNPCVST